MRLPLERGPISRHVIETLTSIHEAAPVEVGTTPVIEDPDAQLALWILYELHYRGFASVPDDREWDLGLIALRRTLERRFEEELREAVQPLLERRPG